ncbi:MBL fold metallo-hydrolase [Streptomyces halstedii]|uniref:MBL fold metallo-hydrolase n=1 Tax=Streptomyces halstedii TaxID=1944 RepID=A0ABS6U0M6_STRHA|nr:MBL fold metallo-hydrolase [Streptomyces halstedii]MBV7674098.1 MBL fold metallo-hydrolase [Streptomyces halstedii]
MLIGAVGHGCYSVVAGSTHLVIDPLFTPTFLGGTVEPYPRRTVQLDRLPPVDAVFLSHSHAGHLEPESLAALPRTVPVLAPPDPTIRFVLERMGFTGHTEVRPGSAIDIPGGRLSFVGSGTGQGYAGIMVQDGDGSLLYLGDRGDLDPGPALRAAADGVDLAIVSHPSDYHSFLQHSTWDGGAHDGDTHRAWLARSLDLAASLGAGLTVPGTTGNRYLDPAAWLNRYVFPMRPAEFVDLLARVAPDRPGTMLDPGDAVDVTSGKVTVLRDVLPFVRRVPHADDRGLDPTDPPGALVDDDPEGVGAEALTARCRAYLYTSLVPWATARKGSYGRELRTYASLRTAYRVTLHLPGGALHTFRLRFTGEDIDVTEPPAPPPLGYGEVHLRIAASVLDRWTRDVIPYFVAAAGCRRAGAPHAVGRLSDGSVSVRGVPVRDLVTMHLTAHVDRYHRWLAGEVDRHLR